MAFPAVKFKPGPTVLSAALYLAGFSDLKFQPAVTDACGVLWSKPTELQVALALCGGESSGHAWSWNVNTNGSTDYGILEINSTAHPEWFGPVRSGPQLCWDNYSQNAIMAWQVYVAAGRSFQPWNAHTNGGYLHERWGGRSWMHWAQHGVGTMWGQYTELRKTSPTLTSVQVMQAVASTINDPLKYWAATPAGTPLLRADALDEA